MPAHRTPRKMDNPYTNWSPLPSRPRLRWPGDARVALCVVVSLEYLEFEPPEGSVVAPSAVKYTAYPNLYDMHDVSHHEYGNRVGAFRIMRILDGHGIRATAAIDAGVAEKIPFLVEECIRRKWEIAGHGIALSRLIGEHMSEDEERQHLRYALDSVERAAGERPTGWVSPDYGESTRTVGLLAELGVRYVCDWPNDDQPYRMTVASGDMISVPVTIDLDDVFTLRERRVPVHIWGRMLVDAFHQLHREGAESGRLLVLNLHPYLVGQPFRSKVLAEALDVIMRRSDDIWIATAGEIADWYRSQE
jgi:allantoinase